MNRHALDVLELGPVLALIAERASSSLGAARIRALEPTTDRAWIDRELTRVTAARTLLQDEIPWTPDAAPDLVRPLARLAIGGTVWSGQELRTALVLLAVSRQTRDALRDERRPAVARAILEDLSGRLIDARDLESRIERAIGDDGAVRDDASPLLRRVRRELAGAEGELIALLERVMRSLESHYQVPDASVTVRNGRYVIPVRREGARMVGGIVQDTSATGATLFIEPPAAVEAGNRIRELETEERREVERILEELTATLRPRQPALADALDALVELDMLAARARFAIDYGCAVPELADPRRLRHS